MTDRSEHEAKKYLGGYAMRQLNPQERAFVEAHLAVCRECVAELRSIQPMANLLPLVDPSRLEDAPVAPVAEISTKLFARVAQERRAATIRRRSVALAAAAAVLVALIIVVPTTHSGSSGESVQFAQAPSGVEASAKVANEKWGTEIHLTVAGLTGRQTVWLEQPDGKRASAGSFEGAGAAKVDLVLSTGFKATDAVALCVSPPDAPPVLRAPLRA